MSLWHLVRADAQRSGVTAESVKAATKARQMTIEEAEKILGIDKNMSYEQVLQVKVLQAMSCECTAPNFCNFELSSTDTEQGML